MSLASTLEIIEELKAGRMVVLVDEEDRENEGALVMVAELLSGGEGGQASDVFQLAQHIDSDQSIEIARMKSLLAEIAASSPT